MANLKYNSKTGNYFKKLTILRFNDLVNFNQTNFMYKYVNNKRPYSFINFFAKLNNFDRSLSLTNFLRLIRKNTSYFPFLH